MTPYASRRSDQRVSVNADQAEVEAIRHGSSITDQGLYDDIVAGALDDYKHGSDEAVGLDWHDQDIALDDAVGGVQGVLLYRANVLGDAYPFEIDRNKITYRPRKTYVYEFCLAASVATDLRPNPFAKIPRLFERISAQVVERYLGETSKSAHVGEPRDPPVGFKTAMAGIAAQTLEWVWQPDQGMPDEGPPSGDHGLDFVVWKEFADQRAGWLFILGQCACGNDWEGKLPELDVGKLRRWFGPMTLVEPVRSFTSPRAFSDGLLREACQGGLAFDRIRLAAIANAFSDDHPVVQDRKRLVELSDHVFKPS